MISCVLFTCLFPTCLFYFDEFLWNLYKDYKVGLDSVSFLSWHRFTCQMFGSFDVHVTQIAVSVDIFQLLVMVVIRWFGTPNLWQREVSWWFV